MVYNVLVNFRMLLLIFCFFMFPLISFTLFDYFLLIFCFVLFWFDSFSMFLFCFCSAVALLGPILAQVDSSRVKLASARAPLGSGRAPAGRRQGAGSEPDLTNQKQIREKESNNNETEQKIEKNN